MTDSTKELEKKLKITTEALKKIATYYFRGYGPGGCDTHNVPHPCGPCRDQYSEKYVAKKALRAIGEEFE